MFDPITYFENLTDKLKVCRNNDYHFTKVSGLTELEGVLQNRKRYINFIAVDDSENGMTSRARGHGYFERRPYTVFICSATKYGDMDARNTLLNQHRTIFRSFMSQIIKDRADDQNNLLQFDSARIPFYEIPGMFGGGCVGIWFLIYIDNPIDLTRDADDWYTE